MKKILIVTMLCILILSSVACKNDSFELEKYMDNDSTNTEGFSMSDISNIRFTPSPTPTATPTPIPTPTPTPSPTPTPEPTVEPTEEPDETIEPEITPEPTEEPTEAPQQTQRPNRPRVTAAPTPTRNPSVVVPVVTPDPNAVYKCNICGAKFTTQAALSLHKAHDH